jgi:uncharacterized membrane protein
VVGLAAAGLAVSCYLTWTKLTGGAPVCAGSDGCAVVQSSRYATFLSVPTAAWGAAFYGVLGGWGLRGFQPRRWLAAFLLAVAGVAFSGYLTGVALIALQAACALCLTSAALTVALLATLLRRRPGTGSARAVARAPRPVGWGVATAGVTVAAAAWLFAMDPAASLPRQQALAVHLREIGAVMYGAYWCPVCREQKARFGSVADRLPYVECDPTGAGARPDECLRTGVQRYPTWVIGGTRHEGLLTLDELARLSGFGGSITARASR